MAFVDPVFKREPYDFSSAGCQSEKDDSFPFKELAHEYEPIREQIRSVASKVLFHWTEVPVEFPESLVGSDDRK